jgi:hypothetical protein
MGGNTGVCMGGWFRNEIKGKADLSGTKIRSLGLGGEIYRRLGATPQTTPPAEILTSLQSGVIDAVEFVGPGTDIALGLYRVASFSTPASTSRTAFRRVHRIVERLERARLRTQVHRRACLRCGGQLRAGRDGTAQHRGAGSADRPAPRAAAGVPQDLITAARGISTDVLGDLGGEARRPQGA